MPGTLVTTPDPEDGDAVARLWERDRTLCRRCLTSSAVSFGAQYICGQCGKQWQREPVEVSAVERDDLSTASLPTDRLRTSHARPQTPADRAEARRRVDRVADRTWLVLSTVHSAKGLEWDVVHLLHVTEGSFPSDMGVGTAGGPDEERRLFHVALTRARDSLHLYAPLRYHHHRRARDDRHGWAQRSRFLDDAALACCDRTTRAPEVVPAPALGRTRSAAAATVAADLDALWV